MTPEKLEMYKKLQPLFSKDWKLGDMYYCPRQAEYGSDGIKYITGEYGDEYRIGPCCPDVAIHLPLPIDPINTERGLLGMIKGFDVMYKIGSDKWYIETAFHKAGHGIEAPDPETALLKALIWQMEEK